MKSNLFHKKGFILVNTLTVFLVFSSLLLQLTLHHHYQRKQIEYYHKAQKISFLHLDIVKNIRTVQSEVIYSSDYIASFTQMDETQWEVIVSGPMIFTILISLDIEKMTITEYNINGL